MSNKYVYWRELGDMFKAYTAPKLCRVLDANGIPYRMDAKNKPMVERVLVDSTYVDQTPAAEPEAPVAPSVASE